MMKKVLAKMRGMGETVLKMPVAMTMISMLVAFGFTTVMGIGSQLGPAPAYAANEMDEKLCSEITDPVLRDAAGCDDARQVTNVALNVIQVAIGVAGVVAVGVIVIAGQRMIVANGEAGKIAAAKNMLLYAIIGLAVAVLAFAIVNFVSGAISSTANTGQ